MSLLRSHAAIAAVSPVSRRLAARSAVAACIALAAAPAVASADEGDRSPSSPGCSAGGAALQCPAVGRKQAAAAMRVLERRASHRARRAAKRPRRGSRPEQRRGVARTAAAIYTGEECRISDRLDYRSDSTVLKYTWRTYVDNGVTYGYYLRDRFGWEPTWPSGYDRPVYWSCSKYLGTQLEFWRWSGGWQYFGTVNCDYLASSCRKVG
jgi:hypothetical protein